MKVIYRRTEGSDINQKDEVLLHNRREGLDAESLLGESGLAGFLKKQLVEDMLVTELTIHLAFETRLESTKTEAFT
nr:hypothetical protein [uncultured Pseudogulbenkiania sp.]